MRPPFRATPHEPIRLLQVGGDLGYQLGRGYAHRGRQAQLRLDDVPDRTGDLDGGAVEGFGPGDVEKGLIDRDGLHGRGIATQDLHDLATDLAVLAPVDGHEYRIATQRSRSAKRHG